MPDKTFYIIPESELYKRGFLKDPTLIKCS